MYLNRPGSAILDYQLISKYITLLIELLYFIYIIMLGFVPRFNLRAKMLGYTSFHPTYKALK